MAKMVCDEADALLATFRQTPVPIQAGAESAGLGKENTVDEKVSAETGGEKAAPTLIDISVPLADLMEAHQKAIDDPKYADMRESLKANLRALLGMEKEFPNFPRPSQNQTVSSGVDGAHEGRTADKCAQVGCGHDQWRHDWEGCDFPDCQCTRFKLAALAESSLSSPPLKEKP